MRGTNLALSPRVRQTIEKALEIRIAMRQHVDAFTGGKPREVMLDRSNFIEHPMNCGIVHLHAGMMGAPLRK
jgi:hypothetical protein